jgi:hypothetical protein
MRSKGENGPEKNRPEKNWPEGGRAGDRFWIRTALCVALAGLAAACQPHPPRSFQVVDVSEAQRLIGAGGSTLIEALDTDGIAELPQGAAIRWPVEASTSPATPDVPEQPALIVATSHELGYRSAAALARNRDVQVVLVVADSPEKRRALWSQITSREEDPGERDS